MSRLNSSIHKNLTDSVISKLFNKGIYTSFDFINKSTDFLIKDKCLSFKEVVEIKTEISKFHGGCKFINASELLKNESIISTGIVSLDKLLEGGLHSKQIYEFCGASSSGKTQLCLTIATCISLEKNKVVHYIDTKGDFSVLRVAQILNARKCSNEETGRVLNNIKVTQVKNVYELISILHQLSKILKNESDTKLLVIDSLSTLFLVSTKNPEATHFLNNLQNVLRFITNEYNVPVITTNLVTRWSEEIGSLFKDDRNSTVFKPTLGKYWFHIPNTRLLIEKVKREERKISVWQSSDLKVGINCNVNIICAGVC